MWVPPQITEYFARCSKIPYRTTAQVGDRVADSKHIRKRLHVWAYTGCRSSYLSSYTEKPRHGELLVRNPGKRVQILMKRRCGGCAANSRALCLAHRASDGMHSRPSSHYISHRTDCCTKQGGTTGRQANGSEQHAQPVSAAWIKAVYRVGATVYVAVDASLGERTQGIGGDEAHQGRAIEAMAITQRVTTRQRITILTTESQRRHRRGFDDAIRRIRIHCRRQSTEYRLLPIRTQQTCRHDLSTILPDRG